ncbi:MAG: ubiquinol-cytochrome C chaperone family protein [Rhizomicrobium sp.]
MLNALRQRGQRRRLSDSLCAGLAAHARSLVFFRDFGVADTIDGRFDMLVFHAWLVLDALAGRGEQGLSQVLVDAVFVQFDEALREQGAGDMGIGRRMTKMGEAFYGRLKAYREAADHTQLAAAILRNVYRGAEGRREQALALATYAAAARDRLACADLTAGQLDFGSPAQFCPANHANA